MSRVIVKKGFIYSVKMSETEKRFFQYILDDKTQLNSEVIAVFSQSWPLSAHPDVNDILNGDIDFYSHTIIKFGVHWGLWEKYGKGNIAETHKPVFRCSEDMGNANIKISERWYIWTANKELKRVGKLEKKYQEYELGMVFPAPDIVERIKHGKFLGVYPGF